MMKHYWMLVPVVLMVALHLGLSISICDMFDRRMDRDIEIARQRMLQDDVPFETQHAIADSLSQMQRNISSFVTSTETIQMVTWFFLVIPLIAKIYQLKHTRNTPELG